MLRYLEELRADNETWVYYTAFGALSLELDREHTDDALTEAEMALLSAYLPRMKRCLHLCCGAGRHVAAFAHRGIASIGLDISLDLLAYGRIHIVQEATPKWLMVQGDAATPPIRSGVVDSVTLIGNSIALFSEERVRLVFAAVHRLLPTGGMFILDIPDATHVLSNLDQGSRTVVSEPTASFGTVHIEKERTTDAASRTLFSHERWSFEHPTEGPKVIDNRISFRLYRSEDITASAAANGFRVAVRKPLEDHSGRYAGMLKQREFFFLVKDLST